jgi:hypothetical protein
MRCTYRDTRGLQCNEDSILELEWKHSINDGWVIQTNRVYCQPHGELVLRRFEKEHQAVNVYEGKKVTK